MNINDFDMLPKGELSKCVEQLESVWEDLLDMEHNKEYSKLGEAAAKIDEVADTIRSHNVF
jgi:muramidase (phage lysozyme)